MALLLGVDDSGRGPVIGPMVLAGCLIDEKTAEEFKKLGVKDSKKVLKNKREVLARIIKEKALGFEILIVHPDEIDARNGAGVNLNDIEAIKSAEIINKLNDNSRIIKVAVDCPSPNIVKWKAYLEKRIQNKENLIMHVEHKADVNHVACSAASILAKTTRDAEIEKIKKKIGVDFGSGYSSDPVTMKFLNEYFHKHKKDGIFRETWGTVADHKAKKEQKKLGEF
jgi:ribonuclease HII